MSNFLHARPVSTTNDPLQGPCKEPLFVHGLADFLKLSCFLQRHFDDSWILQAILKFLHPGLVVEIFHLWTIPECIEGALIILGGPSRTTTPPSIPSVKVKNNRVYFPTGGQDWVWLCEVSLGKRAFGVEIEGGGDGAKRSSIY